MITKEDIYRIRDWYLGFLECGGLPASEAQRAREAPAADITKLWHQVNADHDADLMRQRNIAP